MSSSLKVITKENIGTLLAGKNKDVIECIKESYLSYYNHTAVVGQSSFLHMPPNRSIALSAHPNKDDFFGTKWIASFPGNINNGTQRAFGSIILNCAKTGRPQYLLEASDISAKRTAASAVLACSKFSEKRSIKLGFIGCGTINWEVFKFIKDVYEIQQVYISDVSENQARTFAKKLSNKMNKEVKYVDTSDLLLECDVSSIATNVGSPYIDCPIKQDAIVLHLSLRDIAPELLKNTFNVTDDINHVLKEGTSLALIGEGKERYVHSTLRDFLALDVSSRQANGEKPIVFSPFGLGVLDISLANYVVKNIKDRDFAIIENFS